MIKDSRRWDVILRESYYYAQAICAPDEYNYRQRKLIYTLTEALIDLLAPKEDEEEMHKKIMKKAATALKKDAAHYEKEAKHAKGKHKKEEMTEKKEAISAAKDLSKRAKKAHEY